MGVRWSVDGRERSMAWVISVFLLLLWALAVVSARTLGGAIHVLLIAAIALLTVRLYRERRTPV